MFIIADKPQSCMFPSLEQDILEATIGLGINIALIPAISEGRYIEGTIKFTKYLDAFKQIGHKVEIFQPSQEASVAGLIAMVSGTITHN